MIFYENVFETNKCVFPVLFPLIKGPGRAHIGPYGPIWALMGPKNPERYVRNSLY